MSKSSSKKDLSPNPNKCSKQKLKENNNNYNNIKFNNSMGVNNMKCINVNIIECEDNEKKHLLNHLVIENMNYV